MVEMINSLEDLCRLCAGKIDVLMGLNIFASDNRQIFKKICVCLPIQVSADDSFPKMVCVECACKLDLMFDFRERSILTAHLFSDMITVNSGNVMNVEQNVIIEGEKETSEGSVFNSNFIQTSEDVTNKGDGREFETELNQSVSNSSENTLQEIQTEIADDKKTNVKVKGKTKNKSQRRKMEVMHPNTIQVNEKVTTIRNEEFDDKKLVFNCDNSLDLGDFHSEDNELSNSLSNKDILRDEKTKVESILNPDEPPQGINECSSLDWFFCNICNKTFADKDAFDLHSTEHCHSCPCGVNCVSEEALRQHVSECHPTNLNHRKKVKQKKGEKLKPEDKKSELKVCPECGKQYQTNYKLQEHMRKHTGEKPFSCSYPDCNKAFRSKIGLAQHEANHSGQFEFSCSTCGKGFQCKSYLVVHQRVHSDLKPFICKQCSRRFKTKQSLLDHMNRHLGVKPFLCDICGRGFITKGLCKSHQKVHSGTDNRQYPCHVCRKLFVSKSYLNTHFRIHTGEKPFMCEVCGKGFLTRVDLRIHSTMHTGEKSFVCEMCGKAFARRDALRCHRRSHTGERPYKCEFCGQSFTQFSPMAIHKRLHTGERPYECDVCNKTFVSRSTMLAHRKKHHTPTENVTRATNNEEKTHGNPRHQCQKRGRLAETQFQFVEVEVQQEELNCQDEPTSEQLVVIEESPQLLLALSKRRSVVTETTPEMISIHKLKNENSAVPVE